MITFRGGGGGGMLENFRTFDLLLLSKYYFITFCYFTMRLSLAYVIFLISLAFRVGARFQHFLFY